MILRQNQIRPESGKRMQAIGRILEGRHVKDLGLFVAISIALPSGNKMDEEDHGMRVVHRHANLRSVPLPEDSGKDERMLIFNTVLVGPFFHDAEGEFIELRLFNVVDKTSRRADRLSCSHGGVLMQDL